jgi:hypothetical protein
LTGVEASMIPAHIGIMAEVYDDICEVKVRGEWTRVTIERALKLDSWTSLANQTERYHEIRDSERYPHVD